MLARLPTLARAIDFAAEGLARERNLDRRKRLCAFVEVELIERLRERTLPADERVWRRWGALCGASDRPGRPLPVLDALIAAVAQVNGLTGVTRNEADFVRCRWHW